MIQKSKRILTAKDTLQILKSGYYTNGRGAQISIKEDTQRAIQNSKLFWPDDFPTQLELNKSGVATRFEVTKETTLEAAQRLCAEDADCNPFVLNFASAKNPGGGFLGGAQAQEESLARSSALYPCLTKRITMYEANRAERSCLYSDAMIYSPLVPVFRNDDGDLLSKPYLVTFLTSSAVNAGVVKRQEPQNIAKIGPTNRERARKLLWVANQHEHSTLILGAWGCGVFQNDPREIAAMFAELLKGEFAGCFERVVMAIYDKAPAHAIYQEFVQAFAD